MSLEATKDKSKSAESAIAQVKSPDSPAPQVKSPEPAKVKKEDIQSSNKTVQGKSSVDNNNNSRGKYNTSNNSPKSRGEDSPESKRKMTRGMSQNSLKIKDKHTIGDYILLEMIGKGGYGTVYKGLHRSRGNFVAIKKISLTSSVSEDQLNSLMMEIKLLQRLRHMNIVKYIDHVLSKNSIYIVMEYMELGSLERMVKKHGIFPEELAVVYVRQILEGLYYLHEQGVVHRDIKAANTLISTDGSAKLADFGVATQLSDMKADAYGGTPYWMAPEVITMQGVTTACDIWSLGCTVIELLTGNPPNFELEQVTALYAIVSDDHPPLPEGISESLKDFLMQCFQKDEHLRVDAARLLSHPWLKSHNSRVLAMTDVESQISTYNEQLEDLNKQVEKTSYPSQKNSTRLNLGMIKSILADNNNNRDRGASLKKQATLERQPTPSSPRWSSEQSPSPNTFTRSLLEGSVDLDSGSSSAVSQSREGLMIGKRGMLSKYKESNDDDFDDFDGEFGAPAEAKESPAPLQLKLKPQEADWSQISELEVTFDDNNNNALMQEKFRDQLLKDIVNQIDLLSSEAGDPEAVKKSCGQLRQIFKHHPTEKLHLITKNGIIPILELLELHRANESCVISIMQLINQVGDNNDIQDALCLLGGIPEITQFSQSNFSYDVRLEVSKFVKVICTASSTTLHMFVSCRGFQILVSLLEINYMGFREVIHYTLDSIIRIFKLETHTPKNAFCHLFAKHGMIEKLANSLDNFSKLTKVSSFENDVQHYFHKLADTFHTFSQADSKLVKQELCKPSVVSKITSVVRMIAECQEFVPRLIRDAVMKFLKFFKNLSNDPKNRDSLEEAGVIETLVAFLKMREGLAKIHEIHNQALNALFNMCQLSRKRQEAAAVAGVIPSLHDIIHEKGPLRALALSIFFPLLLSSQTTRDILWKSNSLPIYFDLLGDSNWYVDAMESIAAWLGFDTRKLEEYLGQRPREVMEALKTVFQFGKQSSFVKIVQPLLNMVTISPAFCKEMANLEGGIIPNVLELLEATTDTFSRIRLLRILKSLFLSSDEQGEMLAYFKLHQVIQQIAQSDQSVIVSQITSELLISFVQVARQRKNTL